jgi:hypothetical protein
LAPLFADEEARLREEADAERRPEALDLALELRGLVPERGLLFEVLRLLDPLPLFEAVERALREPLFAELLALEPLERCELAFRLLDVFACAISPPWVFDSGTSAKMLTPLCARETLWGNTPSYPGRPRRGSERPTASRA